MCLPLRVLRNPAGFTPEAFTAEPAASAGGSPPLDPARIITFDHGLQLIVREDHSAPVVSAQVWCAAGSIHEGRWLGAGLSHVLEHMLFKGTTRRSAGQIDLEVQAVGGSMNAYTSFDRTVYHIDAPSTGLDVALDILGDIVQNATIPSDELEKEKQVILREMDMNQDDPRLRSGRRLFECAYTRSPYRYTVIGYPDIFNELKREDVLDYYREKYAPNNLFFVVVGDVSAATVEQQVRRAFASAKARPAAPMVLPEEPPQTAPREVVEEGSTELAHLHLSWHIPDVRHPDVPLLDVLATLLGAGRSSRLYQEVRERKGLVHSADAWTYNPGLPGLFGVSAVADGDKHRLAVDAMLAEVERLRAELVTEAEVTKARKQFVAGWLAMRKTMAGQAQDLGANWLAANDLDFSSRYLEAVKHATPQELLRVARQYLTPTNRTLYALVPPGTRHVAEIVTRKYTPSPIRKFDLPNGLRLLVKEDARLPFVDFRAVFLGGVLAESKTTSGLTLLMSRMLLKGTTTRSAEAIAREMESVGGSLDSYGGNNSFGVTAEVLREDYDLGLDVLADVLLNPTFPGEPLERERQAQLAAIRAQRDQLLQRAGARARRELFGDEGYGLDVNGTEASVAALGSEHLRSFHQRLVTPANGVLAVFGAVRAEEVVASVEKELGRWLGPAASRPQREAPVLTTVRRVEEVVDKKQAVLVLAFAGASLYSPDHYALEVLQEACSDLGSRLFKRIRDDLGLAYYVGAQNVTGVAPGYFTLYAGTEPAMLDKVQDQMLREIELLRTEGLTEEELRRTKAKILGQKKIGRQDLGAYAMASALDELYGLGYQHSDEDDARFEAVTLEEARAVARRYLTPEAMVISIVRPDAVADTAEEN